MRNSKFLSVQFSMFLALLIFLSPFTASAQVESLGNLSFVVPQAWKYDRKSGFSVATLSQSDGRDYCILLITEPFRTTHNANVDFALAWQQIVMPSLHDPLPDGNLLEHNSRSGYSGKLNGDTSPGRGQNRWVGLFVLETGTEAIPVVVVASTNEVYLRYYDTVVKFLDSVRLGNRASLVGNNQVEAQRQVGQQGAQAYYQQQVLEEQNRRELRYEQRHQENLHTEMLQQQRRQEQRHQDMLRQERRR